ncbi:hypothetical protein EPUS_00967 [Endocarpon pusillum Z07020]|uniref:Uncharacterized protein n=1 Tax=Endocarpon pusillum (strain Z07020 / HMAS-L-300199) TaxID=1263415 RepID=U1GN63_ENDPU|nr:uncharacterized protein EPUS_00967 [Endocarpon pusillum Z07020]ERF73713.1 hypothetical protein EPUS_00967 [Endocarpon pusillum Z07020]
MKVSPLSSLLYAFALRLISHSQPSGPNETQSRPPASSFIVCDNIISIATATEAFNRYSANYPEVTRQNVKGPEGQDFRDAFMQCPRVCLMPLGSGNPDITGIGVTLSYAVQASLILSLVVLYLLTRLLRYLARYLGPDVVIFQYISLNFAASISFGAVIITYTIIGRHLPHPTVRFLATLPTFAMFVSVFAVSYPHVEHKIAAEVLPFYQTLGADCPGIEYMQKEFLVPFLSTDRIHILLMSSLAVFLAYWLVHSFHRIYLRHPKLRDFIVKCLDLMYEKTRFEKASMSISKLCHDTLVQHPRNHKPLKKIWKNSKQRSDISKSLKAATKFLGRILLRLLYLAITISGVTCIFRLFHFRKVYGQWQARVVAKVGNTTSTTTTWDDNQWGVGQIVALFVWYPFVGGFGLRVLESGWRKVMEMARSRGSIGPPSPPAGP